MTGRSPWMSCLSIAKLPISIHYPANMKRENSSLSDRTFYLDVTPILVTDSQGNLRKVEGRINNLILRAKMVKDQSAQRNRKPKFSF